MKSSRAQYGEYRAKVREARKGGRHARATLGNATQPPGHATQPSEPPTSGGGPGSEARRGRRHRSFGKLFREFWRLLRGHQLTIAVALACLTVSTIFGLLPLAGTKVVLDNVLAGHPLPPGLPSWLPQPQDRRTLLLLVTAGIVVFSLASLAVSTLARWQTTRVTKRVQTGIRRRVFDHAARLPLHRVYELKSGGTASILREDAGGIAELIFSMLYNPWRAVIQLVGSLAVLALVDWRLLLGSLVLLPIIYLTHQTWYNRIRPLFRDVRASRERIDSHATETFGGMRIVRGFARQRSEAGQFTRNNHLMARQELHTWWWMRGVEIAWSVVVPLASAALLYYGGTRILGDLSAVEAEKLTLADAFTAGDLVMFLSYLIALLNPLEVLATSSATFQNNLAGLDRILDLLSEPTEMAERSGSIPVRPDQVSGRITLRGVSFAYPKTDRLVINNVDLDIQPGETVAFVGRSGAGKTTLCNLIARFYDPLKGHIELDGVDLCDIEIGSYRRLLGIVEQDTFLFDGTVADNIGYGRRTAVREQIEQAARQANAHEFITHLPAGYDTRIGERGVKLSGGQRQRIAIARALLVNPRILILDEATSNLDSESERSIQTALISLLSGRTCFVIAHRLSTIAHADRIVVLEDGWIIEEGSHQQLIAAGGRYHEMVELQLQPTQLPVARASTVARASSP